jgi:hypothetical protein
MSDLKATPGPWVFNKRAQRIYAGAWSGVKIAQVSINPAWEANARLIAAAPDLYEALDPANVRAGSQALISEGHGLLGGLLVIMADKQEAALRKARGETA